jgi:alpha-mannosidase
LRPVWSDISHYWSRLDSLIIVNGIVYRKWESNGNHFDLHIVLPSKLRTIVLNKLHNTVTGGHFGIRKTLSKVKEIFLV